METYGTDFDVEPTLASAVKAGRAWTKQTLRRLADTSGISAGQLNRIENGKTLRPSPATLGALAIALGQHPTPLLILGHQLQGDSARRHFKELLEAMADTTDAEQVSGVEDMLASLEQADDAQLRQFAIEALTYSSPSVSLPDVLARSVPATLPDHDLLARIVAAWPDLSVERRWRLCEIAADMRAASNVEREAAA